MWSSSFSLIWLKPHFTGENTEQKYHPGHNSWLKLLGHRSTEHISGSISALQTHSLGTSSAKHLSIHEAQAQAFFLHFSAHADMLLFLIRSLYYSLSLSSLEANNREWCCLRLTCIHNKKMMFKQGPMWGKCVKTQKAPIKKKNPYQHILLPSENKKKKKAREKKTGRLSEPQTPFSLWSPQTHSLYKYMILSTDTQILPPFLSSFAAILTHKGGMWAVHGEYRHYSLSWHTQHPALAQTHSSQEDVHFTPRAKMGITQSEEAKNHHTLLY